MTAITRRALLIGSAALATLGAARPRPKRTPPDRFADRY